MSNQKEIVVVSGKGGTGKTTITAGLAHVLKEKIIVDADVDAANLHIVLKPEKISETRFKGISVAKIDPDLCQYCGLCQDLCRFNAIEVIDSIYTVNELSCDGCGLCHLACPAEAVEMKDRFVGSWFHSRTPNGDFFHARLIPGAENSGHLVAMVRKQAHSWAEKKHTPKLLIDGPPGIGCPVIAAITGTDLAMVITEPTFSGISDLKRICELIKHFKITCGIIINRADINTNNCQVIEEFAHSLSIPIVSKIPHLDCVRNEISKGNNPVTKCKPLLKEVEKIKQYINKELDVLNT